MATKTLKTKKKLTKKQEMRVAVAKDALSQLLAEKYKPVEGIYIDHDLLDEIALEDGSAQPLLENLNNCRVCAKGAIYLSTVRKFNDVAAGRGFSAEASEKAFEIFGDENLDKIEAAFEEWKDDDGTDSKLDKFIDKYPHAEERLEAILRNVIRNKGTFKP